MGFLRRLLGGDGRDGRDGTADADAGAADRHEPRTAAELDAEERAHELELARFEAERTDDLVLRQQRYADRSWTPPAQGGERRAEEADASS